MDEASLPDIDALLSGSAGARARETTCATLAACCSGEEAAPLRKLLGTTEPGKNILSRLLRLCSQPGSQILAFSSLVNISEDEDAARVMTELGVVERAANALLDSEQEEYAPFYAGMLSNITRFPVGVDALVGKGKEGVAADVAINRLHKLVLKIDTIPNVLWLSNVCSTAEGRDVLLIKDNVGKGDTESNPSRQPLSFVLKMLSDEDGAKRLSAASAVRNCALADDCHNILVKHTNAIGTCLAKLMSPKKLVSLERVHFAPPEVRAIVMDPKKANPEQHVEIRLILMEALLLLCKTRVGRETLRVRNAYEVLDEWSTVEDDDQIQQSISSILDRIVMAEEDDKVEIQTLPSDDETPVPDESSE